jgi:hypothetical protein
MTRYVSLAVCLWAVGTVARAEVRDVHAFPAPTAHCVSAADGRILTSVGMLPYKWVRGSYEVVADSKIGPDPDDPRVLFYDPI